MSCRSAIYAVNSVSQPYAANSQIPFGTVVRRFGRDCQLDGPSIALLGGGYYDVDVSLSIAPTAEGEITAQLYKDGAAVPGALATETASAAGDVVNLHVACLVRNCGQCCSSTLSLLVTAAGTPANLSTKVEKL